jgi:hypothetical protein
VIRLTWRQFRTQAAMATAGLVIVAFVLAITGPHLVHLYNTTVATCKARGDCQTAANTVVDTDRFLQNALTALLFAVPALVGIFWGAPLVARELETGTFRLAWTQSVTRTRWLAAKLGVVGLWGILVTGLLTVMVTWWFGPVDRINANQFSWTVFDVRDVSPVGYAAFAFALGATAGLLIRRTLPAMATTLVGFTAARLAVTHWIRPNLIAPSHTATGLSSAHNIFEGTPSGATTFHADNAIIRNGWTISSQIVDRAGRAVSTRALQHFLRQACPRVAAPPTTASAGGPDPATFQACIAQLSDRFHLAVTYQPAGSYWTIQSLELAIYAALTLVLAGICFRSVRSRLS